MKVQKIFKIIFLSFLVLLSVFSRLYKITDNPPSLFSDEVDAGYQAFVFNSCQNDYFGNKFPTHFHSFSDWRTSLYIYSIAVSQKFFGVNNFSARFPAAFFGIVSCLLFFLLIKRITKNTALSLIGLLIFSLSPWMVHYSRTGFEVSGMIMCLLAGIYFWPKKPILSLSFFCASIYFYSTAKLFVFFLIFLLLILWKNLIKNYTLKYKITLFAVLILLLSPLAIDTLKGTAGYRFSYINIFSDPTFSKTVDFLRYEDIVKEHKDEIGVKTPLFSKLVHNRPETIISTFLKNYFLSFSTDFLVIEGDMNLRQGFSKYGYLFWIEIILVLIGLVSVKKAKPFDLLFLGLLILAPVPFSLTRDSISPHATRLIIMYPSLAYFTIRGLQSSTKNKFVLPIFTAIYLISAIGFYHFYFTHYPQISARSWHYGMEKAVTAAANIASDKKVFFSNKYEPFLPFFLFYTKYLPKDNSCNPSLSIHSEDTPHFSGQSINQQFFFGSIDWSVLTSQTTLATESIFIIPKSEEEKVKESIANKYSIKILGLIEKDYFEQESFTIFSLQ